MDFPALLLIIGAGAVVDSLGDIDRKREPIIPLLGAGLLIVILGTIGRVTGQWKLVAAAAFLYLIGSVLTNYSTLEKASGGGILAALNGKASGASLVKSKATPVPKAGGSAANMAA